MRKETQLAIAAAMAMLSGAALMPSPSFAGSDGAGAYVEHGSLTPFGPDNRPMGERARITQNPPSQECTSLTQNRTRYSYEEYMVLMERCGIQHGDRDMEGKRSMDHRSSMEHRSGLDNQGAYRMESPAPAVPRKR